MKLRLNFFVALFTILAAFRLIYWFAGVYVFILEFATLINNVLVFKIVWLKLANQTSRAHALSFYYLVDITKICWCPLFAKFTPLPWAFTCNNFMLITVIFSAPIVTKHAFKASAFPWNISQTVFVIIWGLLEADLASITCARTFFHHMNIIKIQRRSLLTILTSRPHTPSIFDLMFIYEIVRITLETMATLIAYALCRHREVMALLVVTFLFLTVHTPPTLTFCFNPEMIFVTFFSSASFTYSTPTLILPLMPITIILILEMADSTNSSSA